MKRIAPILVFCLLTLPAWKVDDDSVEEIIARMAERVKEIDSLGWNVWTFSGIRNFSSDKGIDVHGRYRKGEGIRSQVTHLGCADASLKPSTGGPNHFVLILTPDQVSMALTVVHLELPQNQVSMHLGCLRWCGYVNTRREGRYMIYSLASPRVIEIVRTAQELLQGSDVYLMACDVLDRGDSTDNLANVTGWLNRSREREEVVAP